MKQIELTQGKFTLVDDADFEQLNQWKWAFNGKYAMHSEWTGNRYKTVYMHRLILTPKPFEWVDHKNGDGLDNRQENLRICTRSQNNMNSHKPKRFSASEYKGVCKLTRVKTPTWRARIFFKGNRLDIGFFKNEHHAAMAYDIWAKELYGEFAHTNFTKVTEHNQSKRN